MLTLRRVSTVYQYFHPLSSYQFRFKSKKSSDDDSKKNPSHFNEELLKFERKTSDNSRNVFKDRKGSTHDPRKARSITRNYLNFFSQYSFIGLFYRGNFIQRRWSSSQRSSSRYEYKKFKSREEIYGAT